MTDPYATLEKFMEEQGVPPCRGCGRYLTYSAISLYGDSTTTCLSCSYQEHNEGDLRRRLVRLLHWLGDNLRWADWENVNRCLMAMPKEAPMLLCNQGHIDRTKALLAEYDARPRLGGLVEAP